MENASKALVIAGAILISILIIGLGVFIYNGAAGTVKKANLNSQEAQAQNGQFESYFGTHVSATEVKQLLSLVRSNNISSDTNGEDKKVYINGKADTTASAISGGIQTGTYYTVEVMNDGAADPNQGIADTEGNWDKNKTGDTNAGYYNNAYIRNIKIKSNKTTTSSTPSTPTT